MKRSLVVGARQLARFLKQYDITQAAFARTIGVERPTVHDYLIGRRRPWPENRKSIEEATGGFVTAPMWNRPGEERKRVPSLVPAPVPSSSGAVR